MPYLFLCISLAINNTCNASDLDNTILSDIPQNDVPPISNLVSNALSAHEIDFFQTNHLVNISVLQSLDKTQFIVKQNNDSILASSFCAAREKLGVSIAQLIGVQVNDVEIIPAHTIFPGKHYTELPATLHTFAPGTRITLLKPSSPFYKLNIHQKSNSLLPDSERGLTYEVIKNMTKHKELPLIVALDTFISNRGRHGNNYFYSPKSNHFCLIDLESSFRAHLGWNACNCIQTLLDNTSTAPLSSQEITALRVYNETLKKLLSLYTPESMYKQLEAYLFEANPSLQTQNTIDSESDTVLNTEPFPQETKLMRSMKNTVEEQLNVHLKMIKKNYQSCTKLIKLLDKLLQRYQ